MNILVYDVALEAISPAPISVPISPSPISPAPPGDFELEIAGLACTVCK